MFLLNLLAVFLDVVFDPVFDVFRVVSVSLVVRADWQDPCDRQVVVPVEDVIGAVPSIQTGVSTASASRATRIAVS